MITKADIDRMSEALADLMKAPLDHYERERILIPSEYFTPEVQAAKTVDELADALAEAVIAREGRAR